MSSEFACRLNQINEFIEESNLDGLFIKRRDSFSWATCGFSNTIDEGSELGWGELYFTRDERYIISANVEKERFQNEEVRGMGFKSLDYPWHGEIDSFYARLFDGKRVGADVDFAGTENVNADLMGLRFDLSDGEIGRMRELCHDVAHAMADTCYESKPGMTGFEIKGEMLRKLTSRQIEAPVLFIGSDQRLFDYRHCLTKNIPVEKYFLMTVCARRHGLVCATSRLVHFGKLPEELETKIAKLACVDVAFIHNSVPGNTLDQVLQFGAEEYAAQGYPGEWKLHYQGGSIGYGLRDIEASELTKDVIRPGWCFAWNPTIKGTKIEDMFIQTDSGPDFLTMIDGWPTVTGTYKGVSLERPSILVR